MIPTQVLFVLFLLLVFARIFDSIPWKAVRIIAWCVLYVVVFFVDFELCILLEEEKFYMFCLWKYVTLIRLTSISRRVDKITSKQVISSMDNV